MHFTCKRCCVILSEEAECPVCKQLDEITPIVINIQSAEVQMKLDD